MSREIEIRASGDVDPEFVSSIRGWAGEVLQKARLAHPPDGLRLTVFDTLDEMRRVQERERRDLGVVTGGEESFLASHDAWEGHPRIQTCRERLAALPRDVARGVIQHEMSHACLHGALEFYTARYTRRLLDSARHLGMDLALLQHLVYFISVAVKDLDVVRWLCPMGLGTAQRALIEYLLADTGEDRQAWEIARTSDALRRIFAAGLLKTLLPAEAIAAAGLENGDAGETWLTAYDWLPREWREDLIALARPIMTAEGPFDRRLEHAALLVLEDPKL